MTHDRVVNARPRRCEIDLASDSRSTAAPHRPSLLRTKIVGLVAVALVAVSVANHGDDGGTTFTAPDEILVAASTDGIVPADVPPARPARHLQGMEARRVAELSSVLGLEHGQRVSEENAERVAEALDYRPTDAGSELDVEGLVQAYRQRLIPAMARVDVDLGETVEVDDVAAAAELLDVEVDDPASPKAVEKVLQASRDAADDPLVSDGDTTPVFASVGDVQLHAPSEHLRLAGFHESLSGAAIQMKPHDNVEMMTLPTRSRPTSTRSAVDVSVDEDTPALAPVSGIVAGVSNYQLYGQYPDVRIDIIPDADPTKVVTVLHVSGAEVAVGDRVEGGVTPVAERSTLFPFPSQIDRFAGTLPHIHIEVTG